MQVLIVQRRMTEYRVPLFDKMRCRLAELGVDLNVVSGTPTAEDTAKNDEGWLSWGMRFPCRYWHWNQFRFVLQIIPNDIVASQDLVIIPHENAMVFDYWLIMKRYLGGPSIALWGHGANFQSTTETWWQQWLRSWAITHVDWWFAYTSLSVAKVISAGFREDRITCLNNAVDMAELNRQKKTIIPTEVEAVKMALGLRGESTGIFLGSLYSHKRLDFLFAAAEEIKQRIPDFELIIIGDGPLRHLVRSVVVSKKWIHWVGARHGREKVLYLSLGKVMLNPGLVGLGILDSFAMGMPMVTTDCGIHSPEIAYLESGRNGLMVENDVSAFAGAVASLLTNSELHDSMAAECKMDSQRYTLERMVDNFCKGILKALDSGQNTDS